MSDRKKKIAVIAAVVNYIKSEQEAMAFSPSQSIHFTPAMTETKEQPPLGVNFWGMSGRQQQMQMRSMMQMKALHRLK